MKLAPRGQSLPGDPGAWRQGEPLWKRVPGRDPDGCPHDDFMMLAPGLGKRPDHEIEQLLHVVGSVLARYQDWIVLADINLRINVLWVSIRHRPGLMSEIVAAIRSRAPEFKLVGHQPEGGK